MRYRPFTKSGSAASALTLVLDDTPMRESDRLNLIYAAFEAGVNSFDLSAHNPAALGTFAQAIASVDRDILIVTLRLGRRGNNAREPLDVSPAAMARAIETSLTHTGLDRFDAVLVDDPGPGDLTAAGIAALQTARAQRQTRMLAIAGGGETTDGYLTSAAFDVLATPFHLRSDWPDRNRIKLAVNQGMTVVGYGYYAEFVHSRAEEEQAKPKGLAKLFKKADPVQEHAYDFLRRTEGWTAEELCLAFALTEPSLATIQVRTTSPQHLKALAAVVDRDLPTGVPAQIEMARFAAVA